jgi:cytochrome b pre-mRNA-processing protein 3
MTIFSKLISKLSKTPPERAVYSQIVAKARQPWLYLNAGVPDTVTGRFDMITLHSFLVLDRLGSEKERAAEFAQNLFDELFMDMDSSLREMGVGDLSVGKKIRKMSESYYGACNAYRDAFGHEDNMVADALADAFQRNITGKDVDKVALSNLVNYAQKAKVQMHEYPLDDILTGKLDLGDLTREL